MRERFYGPGGVSEMVQTAIKGRHTEAYAGGMERLLQVVQELSLARSLEAVQAIVRHAARALTGADGATFVLREDGLCHYADEEAIAPLWKGQRFPMSACISGWVMLHGQATAIEDIYTDPRIPHEAYRPTFVRSLAMVPIRALDPIGAIGVYWARPHRTTDDELRLIQALADTVAVALENVAMQRELEQRVRDRTAEALAAKEEAERANLAKSRFLAAASHDLRQPLQAIGTWTALLARSLPPSEQGIAGRIQQSVGVFRNILDALLDISRLDGGAIKPDVKAFEIGRLLVRVASACERAASEKGLRLRVVPSAAIVRSDPALLERIVQNFLTNAIRYTPKGKVLLGCRRDGAELRIEVWDTGVGIPADQRAAIFEEYVQLEGGAETHKGMGLGLSIVERVARLLDHPLYVASIPGCGSVFAVGVPRARAKTNGRPPAVLSAPCATGARLLLIEDNPAVRAALESLLAACGIETDTAATPAEAIARLRAGVAVDAIVSDYRLGPDRNGIELVEELRRAAGREIPAVLLTGDIGLTGLPPEARRMALLHKPADAEVLLDAIERLCRGARADGPVPARADG